MRNACFVTVLCLLAACADDDAGRATGDETKSDAGGKLAPDAVARPANPLRPALPRPPGSGLPAELRPPR